MAKDVHASVTFNHVSGLPEDSVVNTFTFHTLGDDLAGVEGDAIQDLLNDFYTLGHGTSASIGSRLGAQLSRTANPVMRLYDITGHLTGTPAGSPVRVSPLANLPGASDPNLLPTEVAACLSFRSDYLSDPEFAPGTRPRARDRGRIYIGPLGQNNCVAGLGGRPVPSGTLTAVILDAAQALRDQPDAQWRVWSRARGTTDAVVEIWLDDAWDTQRRRGEAAQARTIR